MSFLFYRCAPAVPLEPPTVIVPLNNSNIEVTDFGGTVTKAAGQIRLVRPISDGQGYEYCTPGARVRFGVTLDHAGVVEIDLQYTGLVTRESTYNDIGTILVDGAVLQDFNCPTPWTISTPHPIAATSVQITLTDGAHTVEVVFPYCASLDITGFAIPETATMSAPSARVTKKAAHIGDSITHGFNNGKTVESWAYLATQGEGSQIYNLGYGGRALNPGDLTSAGNWAPDYGVFLIGFNNFYPNGQSLTTFKNDYKTALTNWRAAVTAQGKATSKLYCITPLWSDSDADVGTGGYAGNSPTLEQFRQAIRDAITETADSNVVLIEGRGAGMPSGYPKFPDGIHPNASASADIAAVLNPIIT